MNVKLCDVYGAVFTYIRRLRRRVIHSEFLVINLPLGFSENALRMPEVVERPREASLQKKCSAKLDGELV